MTQSDLPGNVLSVLDTMCGGEQPLELPPSRGVVIGHDCGAWIIEEPTGEVLAHRGDARRFVNSSIAAFEATRREFRSRLVSVGESDGTDEALADELESLVATIDSQTVEREDSWWHEVIDSVLRS